MTQTLIDHILEALDKGQYQFLLQYPHELYVIEYHVALSDTVTITYHKSYVRGTYIQQHISLCLGSPNFFTDLENFVKGHINT